MPQVAPFPYFGGKRRVAAEVWARFGDVQNYVEPFFGSGAVLLHRDTPVKTETVNDLDGLLCNFWRAVRADPEGVAAAADWPVSEADLHPRHLWLVRQREDITLRLMSEPEWYDVKAAGWWVWGACAWIGSGWASGEGPWTVEDGEWVKLGNRGQGINRQLPHLGDRGQAIADTMRALQARLRDTRVACGSWDRVVGRSALFPGDSLLNGKWSCGVFLDPPYDDGRVDYSVGNRCAADVRAWAIEHGDNPRLRIALCGYDEHNEMEQRGWTAHRWKAKGGYGNQSDGQGRANAERETVWFSPHCLRTSVAAGASQMDLVKEAS
jgi:DNA adenine methylase